MNGAGWTHCLGAPHLQRRVVAVDVRVDQLWDDVLPQVPQEALSPELRVHLLHPLRHLGRLSLVEESPDSRRDGAHRRHERILRVLVRSRHGGEEVGDGLGCHGGQSRRLDNVGRRVELYCLSRAAIDCGQHNIPLGNDKECALQVNLRLDLPRSQSSRFPGLDEPGFPPPPPVLLLHVSTVLHVASSVVQRLGNLSCDGLVGVGGSQWCGCCERRLSRRGANLVELQCATSVYSPPKTSRACTHCLTRPSNQRILVHGGESGRDGVVDCSSRLAQRLCSRCHPRVLLDGRNELRGKSCPSVSCHSLRLLS